MDTYDGIVIGAGQSGGPLSSALARAGWKTALIEEKFVGGTCINVGCTPTKTMVASAKVAYLAGRARDYGVETGQVRVDLNQVRERKNRMVESFRASSLRRIVESGVELVHGQAHFISPKSIEVQLNDGGVRQLNASQFFINAGARPFIPDLPGLDHVPYLDSTSIMDLEALPEHLLILGGGYIAMEFGQMFRRFGSRVTIIERSGRLLGREDPDIAAAMLEIFSQDGIEVSLNSQVQSVERDSQGSVCLQIKGPQGEQTVVGSHLLLAVGRASNADRLNLPAAGIETDGLGFICVDETLQTNVSGIYALGDVKGGPAFTHISYDDFRVIRSNLLDGGKASIENRLVPYVVFTDPQLGRIGQSEQEAREKGLEIKIARIPMEYISRAVEIDQSRGVIKAVVDAKTEQILGAAVLGEDGGEIMSMIEIAMLGKLPFPALRDAIFAHPTLAEGLNTLFSNFV